MIIFDQITRPFSWLRTINPRTATVAEVERATRLVQQVQRTENGIKLPCKMNAACYQEVLAVVLEVHATNKKAPKGQEFVLDLSDVERLDLTGIFALHCIAIVMRGETIPDPANGWSTMRTAAERNLAAGRQENLKISNPSAPIKALLRANHFDRVLIIESQSNISQQFS